MDLGHKSVEMAVMTQATSAPLIERLTDCPEIGWAMCPEAQALVRRTARGTLVGVTPFLYTWGVFRGGDDTGYEERWCYHTLEEAVVNAHTLDDEGEPTGFIRKV